MRRVHFMIGTATVAAFVLSGQMLRLHHPAARMMEDGPRMMLNLLARVGAGARGELTRLRAESKLLKLRCRGSSLVERRPEKAGVASSILAPGTTRSRHHFLSEEIYFTVSKIDRFTVLYPGFECERPKVFC
jgi:hypothetical protein